ncbi:MAG TPA: peptidoglycan DD-metalloendopeptidase family protein, partial [Actinomycetota bacterium]
MNRRRPAGSLLLALLLALAAAGCSGSGDPPPAGGAAAPPATTEAPATTTTTAPAGPSTTAAPAPVRYRYPVAGCRATYGQHSGYPAADMFTGRGCAFVAPVAGRVDEVTRTDSWRQASDRGADRGGRSVSLVGVDGVRYYGSHLEAVASGIAPGVTVRAGRLLGRVGNSGSASITPVHLHFGISWPTRPG